MEYKTNNPNLFWQPPNSYPHKIRVEAIYHAKRLYIKNAGPNGVGCIERIVINNKDVSFKNTPVFTIYLDSLGFKPGALDITIYHKPDCKPYIMSDVSTPKRSFQISLIGLDKSGTLRWTAMEGNNKNPFIIEQLTDNKWSKIGEVESKANGQENEYFFKITSKLPGAEFRLMQLNELGGSEYSKSIKPE